MAPVRATLILSAAFLVVSLSDAVPGHRHREAFERRSDDGSVISSGRLETGDGYTKRELDNIFRRPAFLSDDSLVDTGRTAFGRRLRQPRSIQSRRRDPALQCITRMSQTPCPVWFVPVRQYRTFVRLLNDEFLEKSSLFLLNARTCETAGPGNLDVRLPSSDLRSSYLGVILDSNEPACEDLF